jgi:hypothetical protein
MQNFLWEILWKLTSWKTKTEMCEYYSGRKERQLRSVNWIELVQNQDEPRAFNQAVLNRLSHIVSWLFCF